MNTWVALLRGINIGGRRKLPMAEMTAEFSALGLRDVRTYIQSGNAVFRSRGADARRLGRRISRAIDASHGFATEVVVLGLAEYRAVVAANPFRPRSFEPHRLYTFFLAAEPSAPDLDLLDSLRRSDDGYVLRDRACYVHAPEGFARSRIAPRVEAALGVPATSRNWRTVTRLLAMADELAGRRLS